jgi:putative aminopeptidase FrvX
MGQLSDLAEAHYVYLQVGLIQEAKSHAASLRKVTGCPLMTIQIPCRLVNFQNSLSL